MKKKILVILASLAVLGVGGGIYFFINANSVDPAKSLGSNYWGDACRLSPTGFIVCTNEFGVRFDSCVVGQTKYRLKVSVTEPRYQPKSLEMWTQSPYTYQRSTEAEIYTDGVDACYHEGFRFTRPDLMLNRGSSCDTSSGVSEGLMVMFWVGEQPGQLQPCTFSNEKLPEPEDS